MDECIFYRALDNRRKPYRSYTLQACAWLDGRLDLGTDYPWLELAIYEGKYYVSFPPFPSLVLLPFAAIFGTNTPDHWISLVFSLVGIIYALRLYRTITGKYVMAGTICFVPIFREWLPIYFPARRMGLVHGSNNVFCSFVNVSFLCSKSAHGESVCLFSLRLRM